VTNSQTKFIPQETKQRAYARAAGFLFLWLIATGLAGALTISHILGSGTFAESARAAAASERLYRIALSCELVETLSAALLAFALYVTLKPFDQPLSQLAMIFRLGESFLGAVGMIFAFSKLHLYLLAPPAADTSASPVASLVDLMGHAGWATYNISALFFSIGSILFYYLFLLSRYIPRPLSAFGILASAIVTIMCLGSLIDPQQAARLQYGWAGMAIAEVATGLWLMIFAVKVEQLCTTTTAVGG